MENSLRKLNFIIKMFPWEAFYTVSFSKYNIDLQGDYKPETVIKARELRFISYVNDPNGYFILKRSNIKIILT